MEPSAGPRSPAHHIHFDPKQCALAAVSQNLKKSSSNRESAMLTSTHEQLEVPGEMRAVAERSIERAKLALDIYIRAIQQAAAVLDERVEASQAGVQDVGKSAMNFALRNVISAFEFAQKIVQAKSITEFVRLLNDFLQAQGQVLNAQVKDLGETLSRAAMESMKPTKAGDLSS
jgi:phasin